MEEEDNITFPYWNRVDEYWDTVDPTSLLSNFAIFY